MDATSPAVLDGLDQSDQLMAYTEPELLEMEDIELCDGWLTP
jgi:hypothetical protein